MVNHRFFNMCVIFPHLSSHNLPTIQEIYYVSVASNIFAHMSSVFAILAICISFPHLFGESLR